MGHLILRIISRSKSVSIAAKIRDQGYRVTMLVGEGRNGPVDEHYVVCRRRDLKSLLQTAMQIDPEAFYVTEQAGSVSNVCRPIMQPVTVWRAVFKKK